MRKILIIDDDAAVRATLRRLLESRSYQVLSAADGAAGLRLAAATAIDLVLLDIIMPGTDGFEALAAIRHRRPDLPVIAISGGGRVGGQDVLEAARRLGAARTIQKPFEIAELLAGIESCLDPARRAAPAG